MKTVHAVSLSVVVGVATFCLIVCATATYGTGISADSVEYVGVAHNLASSNGFTTRTGEPFVVQPPLFPLSLALMKVLFGIDPVDGARWFNALLAGLTAGLGTWILARCLQPVLATAGVLALLFSQPQFEVSTYAWSEPLFNLLVLLFLATVIMRSNLGRKEAALLGIVTALACLTRYIGYSLVVTGVIVILAQRQKLKDRLLNSLIFGVIAVLPLTIWIVRNWAVSDTLFGPRVPSRYSLFDNLYYMFRTIFGWFAPVMLVLPRMVIWSIVAILVACIVAVIALISRKRITFREMLSSQKFVRLLILILFMTVYCIILVTTATMTAYDEIGLRLLSPISIALIVAIFMSLEGGAKLLNIPRLTRRNAHRVHLLASGFLLIVLIILPMLQGMISVITKLDQGAGGYNAKRWRESETIEFLRASFLTETDEIYSNRPDAITFLTGFQANWMPSRTYYNSNQPATDLSSLKGNWPRSPVAHILWFDDEGRPYFFSIQELETIANISLEVQLVDGKIYEASPTMQ